MTRRLARLVGAGAFALLLTGCLTVWDIDVPQGNWACSNTERDGVETCPSGYVCDDGLCCRPGGLPACPTLPAPNGTCATGQATRYFEDKDEDGEGNTRVSQVLCHPRVKSHWVLSDKDCDDADPNINSRSPETCNGKDDNCDGVLDEGLPGQRSFWVDVDGDGFGAGLPVSACARPPGRVDNDGDCAPFDASKFPGAPESCNGLDDDCDGTPDEGESSWVDVGPSWPCQTGRPGVCALGRFACVPLAGRVQRQCVGPDAGREVCNGLDDDCDGVVDEQPDCGGPASLTAAPVQVGAVVLPLLSIEEQSTHCQAHSSAATPGVTAGTTWSGSGVMFHTWYAEAPAGEVWDLSASNTQLHLHFDATPPPGSGWGTAARQRQPVVYLCGERDDQLIRYVPNDATSLSGSAGAFGQDFELPGTANWILGRGSGFDTHRVKRVEIMLFPASTPFEVRFSDVGFRK